MLKTSDTIRRIENSGIDHTPDLVNIDAPTVMLAVDDEPAVRDYISAVLRRNGYRVIQAPCGREAPAAIGAASGAIADVIMPNMSENDLLPALKAK